jgi:hypothetical protein
MADYSKMTDDEFYGILESLVSGMTAGEILAIGDVAAILIEELNNSVLEVWEQQHPELAFPSDEDEDE